MRKYLIGIDPGPNMGFVFGEYIENDFKILHRDTCLIGSEGESKGDINNYWALRTKNWFDSKKEFFSKSKTICIEKQFHFGVKILPSYIIYTCLLPLCYTYTTRVQTINPKSVCAHFKLKKKTDSYDTKKKNTVSAVFSKEEQNSELGRLHDQADAILCVKYFLEINE